MSRSAASYQPPLEPAELDELRRHLVDRAEHVAITCWGEPAIRRRAEWRWGRHNGSRSLARFGRKRGLWCDRASGEGGDLFTMIGQAYRCSFPEAIDRALAITGFVPESRIADLTPERRRKRADRLAADREQLAQEHARRTAAEDRDRQAEDKAAIARARDLWAESVPIEATPAWHYLTRARGIPEPAGGFPVDLRWHPRERALIMAARSPSGTVTAAQLVRLTPGGQKRLTVKLPKQTFGRLRTAEGSSFLKLPGRVDVEATLLQHAEGGETGLSGWVATGIETWIAFGSVVCPQRDRCNVVLRDDDAPGSQRAIAFDRDVFSWLAEELTVVVATPWDKPRGDRSDFNDLLRKDGPRAVWARIHTAMLSAVGTAPASPPRPLPDGRLPQTRVYLDRVGREFFRPTAEGQLPAQILLSAEGGAGKTELLGQLMPEASVMAKKAGRPHRFIVLVPEHTLGAQVAKRLSDFGLTVEHMRGRGDPFHPRPDDPCQNPESVKQAIIARQPIRESCCGPGCPVFDTGECRFLASQTRAAKADVVVLAHAYLTQPLSKKIWEGVAALVIDEDFLPVFDRIFSLSVATFGKAALDRWAVLTDGEPDQDATRQLGWTHDKLRAAFAASSDAYLSAEALTAAGLTRDEIGRARKLEWRRQREASMTPGMPLEDRRELARAAAINSQLPRIAAVYGAIESILSGGEAGAGRIELGMDVDTHGVRQEITVHMQHDLAAWVGDLPVLMLNATGKLEAVRGVFPRAVERKAAPIKTPNSRLVQILGGFSKSTMAGSPKKRADLQAFLAVAFPGQERGVVGHKATIAPFADMPKTRTTWHGATAGDDSFKLVGVMVVFDGPRAPPADIAALAAARTGRAVKVAKPVMASEPVLMADGLGVAIPVLRYEDTAAQAVHESIHHAGVSQAVARARQVLRTRTNPNITLLFGNVAADRPVDLVLRWPDVKPDRLVHMVYKGRVLSNSADMVVWHPDQFGTEKAASSARERFGDFQGRVMKMIQRDPRPWSKVRYQPPGQGQHLHTGFCPSHEVAAMRNEAEQTHGELVHWSEEQVSAGRKEDLPGSLSIDVWRMGMTSGRMPTMAAFASPPPRPDPGPPPDD